MLLRILVYVSVVMLFILFVSFFGVYAATHPRKIPIDTTPEDMGLGYEQVNFQTEDGLTLKGWFIPSKTDKTIVVLHGYPFNKANILPFAKFLHPVFQLFLFDFRAMGESDGKLATGGFKEEDDLKSALAYLKTRDDVGDIGVLGFSYGASVALITAPQAKEIKAVVADSAFVSLGKINERIFPFWIFKWPFVLSSKLIAGLYGIQISEVSPLDSVTEMNVPVLFVHGKADSQIPYRDSQILYERANEPKELWLIEGADHGMSHEVAGKEYEKKVRDFFFEHLK